MSSNAVSRLHHALTSRGIKVSSGGAGGGLFRFRCPAHGGKRDSVTASMGDDGRVLLHCHSKGCSAEQITAAVSLTLADLHPAPSRTSAPKRDRRKVDIDGRQLTLHETKDAAIRAAGYGLAKSLEHGGVAFESNTTPAHVFDYFHASGEPAFSVCRWHVATAEGRRKELRQIRKVEGGWVVAGPSANEQRPLYRLKELLTADPCRPVYIVEGERAVDALRGAGFVAVTSAGGSSKPGATDWTPLAGRGVIVLPDNDAAGERYASKVASILRTLRPQPGIAIARLRDDFSGLPEKGDAVEWLAARNGESFQQLQQRLDSLPDITEEIIGAATDSADDAAGASGDDVREEGGKLLQFRDAWAASFKPQPLKPVLIEGLLRRGETANIIASTKTGKSWFALQLLFSVASGREFLGRRVAPGPVVLMDNELHTETLENRLFEIGRAMELGPDHVKHPFEYLSLRGNWRDFDGVAKLCKSRFKRGEISLFCLDAKYRFFVGGLEENSNEDQAEFHNAVDAFAEEMDSAVVLVHHSSKGSQEGRAITDIGSGGGSQARAVDCHAVMRPHSLEAHGVLEAAVRSFPAVEPATIRFDWPLWSLAAGVTPEIAKSGSNRESRREMAAKLRAELATCGEWMTLSKLAERLGTKSGRAGFREAIRELRDAGEVEYRNDYPVPRRKDPTEAIRLKVQI
jgi:hypothetical protein